MVLVTRKQNEEDLEKINQELEQLREENKELTKKISEMMVSTEYNTKDLERLKQIQSKLLTSS